MSLQEAFYQAVAGLAAQGFVRSTIMSNNLRLCAYRGPDGRRCSIGHLIPDSEYDESMEGTAASQLGLNVILDLDISFLEQLQEAHDAGYTPQEMKANLRDVAADYQLNLPAVLQEA